MKKTTVVFFLAIFCLSCSTLWAQETEVTAKNSWLKIGVNAGVPVGDASNFTSFKAGAELKGQVMINPHLGAGVTAGYNQYFGKNNAPDFGAIPLGAFLRYYAQSEGFFAGIDGGYTVFTNMSNNTGAAFLKPQIGYHNYSWNYFAYYNAILRSSAKGPDINDVGIGVSYNIRFK